jgi:hypothetical protein
MTIGEFFQIFDTTATTGHTFALPDSTTTDGFLILTYMPLLSGLSFQFRTL